jgi:hypothetical protein
MRATARGAALLSQHFAGDGARGHLNQAVSRGTAREAVRLNWRPLS